MNKIEEIARKHFVVCNYKGSPDTIDGFFEDMEKAMQEYAEYYAKRCLEIAAEKAQIKFKEMYYTQGEQPKFIVNKESILNIQLPKHD